MTIEIGMTKERNQPTAGIKPALAGVLITESNGGDAGWDESRSAPLARTAEFVETDQSDLPDGQISDLPVQPCCQKYFRFRLAQIKSISPAVSSHTGAYRDRHGRGAGCGGRGSVGR
jgi:hypothetical protein